MKTARLDVSIVFPIFTIVEWDQPGIDNFENGNTDEFDITIGDIGDLTKIRIRHDDTGDGSGWYLEEIRVLNKTEGKEWVFPCNRWLATDEDDGSIDRTLEGRLISWTLGK